ncbi:MULTISPECIES: TetR/AcrR family transcriptional regulator [Mycobacterium]|uniref:Bacterial regulatory protein, tetR family n=2 Tax=Mycobacterium ulcerans group TaxID=2993898 RepID=A0A3E2MNU0_MYCMR|nr:MULTISPECIES: TetR/AcrR family transcriptional regulator [Mycobacterium]EPQ45174.1 Transcriptional regulator, TetR family [Mycobacterium sp. 012931]EPQ70990.1 Transcriptional regulator, TetR family [Mycobacterium marinum MB2]MBC9862996.1 Transcriptional regulator, AcrR family [Mycobacterium pseudoshottsii]MDC8971646.1 TetR/AcrR family transcriptional regulator [Mycobacterium marinum]MDC8984929.1 TetR/AcrR family transcriptional regulator [Mycobacterium marinum]
MARRRGWNGAPPASDEEASRRIVDTAVRLIAETGSDVSLAQVAASLGVIRQTVYRYYPTADALMRAAAIASVDGFLDRLTEAVRGMRDPAEAMAEAVMFTLRDVVRTPHLGILIAQPYAHTHPENLTSEEAQVFGVRMLERFDVDWAEYGFADESARHDLVEFLLRVLLSFFVAPNVPSRSDDELKSFIRRWVGGAILAQKR